MSKYIITDPCYILDDDIWSTCIKASTVNRDFNQDAFDNLVRKQLELLSGHKAWVSSTGYGDWTNYMEGDESKIIQHEFTADSGMVCVCKLTKDVEDSLRKKIPIGLENLVAIIECDNDAAVKLDTTNKHLTVVYVYDGDKEFHSIIPEQA